MTATRIAPSCIALLAQADQLYPGRSRASDGTIGDAKHAARKSDHNPDAAGWVHAADLTHDPAHGCDAHAWAREVAARRDPRVRLLISAGQQWTPAAGWSTYHGENPHDRHAHLSVFRTDSARKNTSPWFAPGWEDDMDLRPLDHTAAVACPQHGPAARWEQTAEGGIWAKAGAPYLDAYNRHPELFPPTGPPRRFLALVPTPEGGYRQVATSGEDYVWNPGRG